MSGFFDYSDSINYPIYFAECNSPVTNSTFRNVIDTHHSYKKFKSSPTRNIRWLIYQTDNSQLLGAISLSSCVLAIKCRDDYIGWNKDIRLINSNKVANNSRFCLIPKATDLKNVASMSLKLLRYVGKARWQEKYGDDLVLIETYVEPTDKGGIYRAGGCYKSDNWTYVGRTEGNSIRKAPIRLWREEDSPRGRLARKDPKAAAEKYGYDSSGYNVTKSNPKLVYVKPITKKWRPLLCNGV
jgi:hypothetical protein